MDHHVCHQIQGIKKYTYHWVCVKKLLQRSCNYQMYFGSACTARCKQWQRKKEEQPVLSFLPSSRPSPLFILNVINLGFTAHNMAVFSFHCFYKTWYPTRLTVAMGVLPASIANQYPLKVISPKVIEPGAAFLGDNCCRCFCMVQHAAQCL